MSLRLCSGDSADCFLKSSSCPSGPHLHLQEWCDIVNVDAVTNVAEEGNAEVGLIFTP